jgi:glycerol-3-phosphate dehydrogenase
LNAPKSRAAALRTLATETFDLLIIGGGVTGAGIARDAALRGLKVALVEKTDFAAGTSSKSSKLVHGGFRYLEHAQFRLVFEGTNERALLMKVAPHLVRPLEFLLPVYKHDKPGLFVLDVGLWIYDGLSKFSSPKLHRTVRAPRVGKIEPGLKRDQLDGALLYYDCATDDARITLENIIDARALGATIVNYARAVALLRDGDRGDRILGAEVKPTDSSDDAATVAIRAKVTINATGPWTDDVRRLAGENGILHASKGVHLVVDSKRLAPRHAVVMKQKKRIVFCIPWGQDRTVIGTTDTFWDRPPEEVHSDAADVAYLLDLANNYFPEAKLVPEDVLATWAGVRPLIKPDSDVATASDVSREHHILERPGLVTIAGGKLTTYRRMAAEVVDVAGKQLGALPPCGTETRPLPGAAEPIYSAGYAGVTRLSERLAGEAVVDAAVAKHLANTYGARAPSVVARVKAEPALGERLDPELAYVMAQVDVAVDEEQALTVEDVLGRRLQLLLRARDQGLGCTERVARRMATRLGWDELRTGREVEHYRAVVASTRQFRK